MNHEKIPLAIPNLAGNEMVYLKNCIDQNFVSSVGPYVNEFESRLEFLTESKFAFATNTGTSAIHLALLACGVKPNSLVISSSYTFIGSVNAISMCGAKPWLFDVESSDWTIDTELISQSLRSETYQQDGITRHRITDQEISCILAVFPNGLPADMDKITEIAMEYNLKIVIDSAAAIGATYKSKKIGHLGDVQILSFNGNKTFTSGGGGAVLTNNEKMAKVARHLGTTGRISNNYDHDCIAFNYRLTNIQAALGLAQLEKFDIFLERKAQIASKYRTSFKEIGRSGFPKSEKGKGSDWLSGIVLNLGEEIEADSFISRLSNLGIEARRFWKPMHLQTPYKDDLFVNSGILNSLWQRVITLPCSTSLTQDQQDTVIRNVQELMGR